MNGFVSHNRPILMSVSCPCVKGGCDHAARWLGGHIGGPFGDLALKGCGETEWLECFVRGNRPKKTHGVFTLN